LKTKRHTGAIEEKIDTFFQSGPETLDPSSRYNSCDFPRALNALLNQSIAIDDLLLDLLLICYQLFTKQTIRLIRLYKSDGAAENVIRPLVIG